MDWTKKCDTPYCLVVVPLLIETSMQEFVDRILVVDCLEKNQIERVSLRDQVSIEDVKLILKHQISREARLKLADDVIVNDGGLEALKEKIIALHKFYTDP